MTFVTKSAGAFLLAAAFAAASTPAARAQAYDPIETRQAGQDLLSASFAGINAVVAAKGDLKAIEFPASSMARWIRQFVTHFPPGTETGHNTKALPTVWSDRAGFVKAANDLAEATEKLAQLAKAGDADGVATQVKAVGAACGACHRTYRGR